MTKLIENIVSKNFDEANSLIAEQFDIIMRKKLHEMKKMANAKWCEEQNLEMNKRYSNAPSKVRAGINEDDMDKFDDDNDPKPEPKKANLYQHKTSGKEISSTKHPGDEWKKLDEEDLTEAQRIKIIKARIRGGKVQRRKKVANVPGYTFRGGKLQRMSPMERRRRKMGQRKGKMKRKIKMQRALMKRKRSMMKRRAIGLR